MKRLRFFLPLMAAALTVPPLSAQVAFDRYHPPAEMAAAFRDLARSHPDFVKIHELAESPGGREVLVIELGPEAGRTVKTLPAVFVGADFEGLHPLAGEAALPRRADRRQARGPPGSDLVRPGSSQNPDAAAAFRQTRFGADPGNGRPFVRRHG